LFRHGRASLQILRSRRRTWPGFVVNGLVVGIISGAFGMAYIVYGKRQAKLVPVIAGLLLCVYPYFTENPFALCAIGAMLLAAPFLVDF
jgi:hypothetical protein